MEKTKIYSELVSGVENGYVTDVSQIKGATSLNPAIVINGWELKKIACKGELIPGQRYELYDYTRPFYNISDEALSLIRASRNRQSINVILRAKNEYEFYSDATISSSSVPYAEEYKIKFDLCGENHVLSTILKNTYSVAGFVHPNGTISTLYEFIDGTVVYQYGEHEEINTTATWGFMRNTSTIEDVEPIRGYGLLRYFFSTHYGVITWMQDRNGNEAHCDWLSFDRITNMLDVRGSELICPIIPREDIEWRRGEGTQPIENNIIGPYYFLDTLQFPHTSITLGFNNRVTFTSLHEVGFIDSIISGNNSTIEDCRGIFYAENSSIKSLECVLYKYDSDGGCHYKIYNSTLGSSDGFFSVLALNVNSLSTLRI